MAHSETLSAVIGSIKIRLVAGQSNERPEIKADV